MTIRVIIEQPSLAKYRLPVFQELSRRPGLDFRLCYSKAPTLPNVEPEGLNARFVPSWRYTLAGRRMIWNSSCWQNARRGAADVLLLNWNLNHLNLLPTLLRARANGVATILWGHGYSKAEANWRRKGRHAAAGLATALLFYNFSTARQFIEQGWPSERIYVALNALDQRPVQAARRVWLDEPDQLAAFKRLQGITDGPVLLYVSRLKPENRVDLLIRATASLRLRHPALSTIIIGTGAELEELKALAQAEGVADAVRFMGALYDEMALAPWFLSADAFCYPANIGLSLLHAFGYGLPVITSDRNDLQNPEIEALEPGGNGLVYRHDDLESLTATLDRLITDRAVRARLAAEAHATSERFNLHSMVDGIERAIRYSAARTRGNETLVTNPGE
ncbi:MAG TPA: glycosyltransferase family 4 protein [Alphaproteobacteria bacterium]|nr:glycosyltransferase family 4 protein [Alphaproteobacteria bacterium]